MSYSKPLFRLLHAETAVASCTPCPTRYEDVYVSWEYSQVGPFGFCNTLAPGLVGVEFSSGTYAWYHLYMTN